MTKEIFEKELSGFPDYLMPELIEKAREIMRSHGIFAEDKTTLERKFNEVNDRLQNIAPWLVDFRNRFKDVYTDPVEVRLLVKDIDEICRRQSNFLRDYLKWREESREMFEEPDYAEFADNFCDSLKEN